VVLEGSVTQRERHAFTSRRERRGELDPQRIAGGRRFRDQRSPELIEGFVFKIVS
jgi:hypothetical protein